MIFQEQQAKSKSEQSDLDSRIFRHLIEPNADGRIFQLIGAGRSANFHSQQKRALNLARCLRLAATKKETSTHINSNISLDSRVAIVGGGISGTSLAVFLALLKFKNITVFEAGSEEIFRQKQSVHRHAHPSYNDWPLLAEESPFSSCTTLPAMNWFAGNASEITARLRSDRILKACKDKNIVKFQYHALVRDLSVEPAGAIWVEGTNIVKREEPVQLDAASFDFVLLANGIGREKRLDGAPVAEYWETDITTHFAADPARYYDAEIIVQGNGDGALIDFQRLCLAPNFGRQNFSLSFIAHLRPPMFRDLQELSTSRPDLKASDAEKLINDEIRSSGGGGNGLFEGFWPTRTNEGTFSADVTKNGFASDSISFFNQFLKKEGSVPIGYQSKSVKLRLKDDEASLFSSSACPINKLVMRFFLHSGIVEKRQIVSGASAPKKNNEFLFARIGVDKSECKITVNRNEIQNAYSSAVASPEAPDIQDNDVLNWKLPQLLFDEMESSSEELLKANGHGHSINQARPYYLEYMLENVADYVSKFFEGAHFTVSLDANDKPEKVIVYCLPRHNRAEVFEQLGGFDTHIFGIPVCYVILDEHGGAVFDDDPAQQIREGNDGDRPTFYSSRQ